MTQISLCGSELELHFQLENDRLRLTQIQRGEHALLQSGAIGNPLAVVIASGEHAGEYGPDSWHVTHLQHDETSLLAYLQHETLPLLFGLNVEVEGNVMSWRGQAGWNGAQSVEMDFYFPLWSKVVLDSPDADRAIFSALSGHEVGPTGAINYARTYLGGLSCPAFLLQGATRGLAVLDDNRADFGADAGACVRRTFVLGNNFPPDLEVELAPSSGHGGPYVGVCHSRVVRGQSEVGLTDADMKAELRGQTLAMEMRGDAVDLGPVRALAYLGDWKSGAQWLREQRRHLPMRRVPEWFSQTTVLSEDLGDGMVKRGQTFHDYPQVLADKERLGASVFHLPGFSEAEIIGQPNNWQNRGDYLSAAHNLGGPDAARAGIEAVHRRGGRVLYYVEGLIIWKRSRIGKSRGREWALMRADGSYDEHYEGFWHMCPACNEWGDWLGQTCADIVQTIGVDGFFIDSTAATHFHRCFNPAHQHPHPDVWNWGIRNLLRRVRQAVDRVNPQTVLLVEGAADLAREFVDGSLAHSSDWLKGDFKVPLARFLHADLNVFESWGYAPGDMGRREDNNEALHLFNAVNGHRIYAHDPLRDRMAALSLHTRRVYDAFPEVCEHPISVLSPQVENCIAQLFDGMPRVLTVANSRNEAVKARLELPFDAGVLFNRVNGQRVPVRARRAELPLQPFELCAFEVRA